jgi:alkanesulfonate monooxygenase SsuD/methylene tetrahydromethanopterin reductase-like flavin-dependent oxidoreductase (luciferase family)
MRELWTKPSITFEGRWESVHEAGIVPLPVQRPIPVWIGGYVEETIKRVGRIGDGWFPRGAPDDEMKASVERMRGYATEAGRDPDAIGLDPQINVGTGTPDEWHAAVEGWKALGANYLTVNTLRNGFMEPKQHLAAIGRAAEALLR